MTLPAGLRDWIVAMTLLEEFRIGSAGLPPQERS
jgi:hypothetical protein